MPIIKSLCDGTPMDNIPACELLNPPTKVRPIGASYKSGDEIGEVVYLMSDGGHSTYYEPIDEVRRLFEIMYL